MPILNREALHFLSISPPIRQASLHLCCLLLAAIPCPLVGAEEVLELGFPANQLFRLESSSNAAVMSGGHSLAVCELDPLQLGQQSFFEDLNLAAVEGCVDRRLALAGAREIERGFVGVARIEALPRFQWMLDTQQPITCMCSTPGMIFAGDQLGTIMALDSDDGRLLWTSNLHSKLVTAVTPISGELCASADWTGKIIVFDARDGTQLTSFQQHRDRVTDLMAISHETLPRLVSTSRDGTLRLWYPTQGRLVRFLQLEHPITTGCAWTTDRVVVATNDAMLHMVDLERAVELEACSSGLDYVTGLLQMDDQHVLAVDGRGRARRIRFTTVH